MPTTPSPALAMGPKLFETTSVLDSLSGGYRSDFEASAELRSFDPTLLNLNPPTLQTIKRYKLRWSSIGGLPELCLMESWAYLCRHHVENPPLKKTTKKKNNKKSKNPERAFNFQRPTRYGDRRLLLWLNLTQLAQMLFSF